MVHNVVNYPPVIVLRIEEQTVSFTRKRGSGKTSGVNKRKQDDKTSIRDFPE